jgi:tagatose 6-phosphate kinase
MACNRFHPFVIPKTILLYESLLMILCVTLNPVVDTTLFVEKIQPVYRTNAQRVTHVAGGKGNNVARASRALGQSARVMLPLGGITGYHVAELLGGEGIETTVVRISSDTRVAVTVVDKHYEQRAFFAPNSAFTPDDVEEVRLRYTEALEGVDAVCVCGSSPGPSADVLFYDLLHDASERGLPNLLDTYGEALRLGLAAPPTIVKANLIEASGVLGYSPNTLDAQLVAVDELRQGGAQMAVLTLGADGAVFAAGERAWLARPPQVAVVNPIGSGDAMTAGLMTGLLRRDPPETCFRLGMASAVANSLTWEACRLNPTDVESLLDRVEITLLR